ncbi:transposase [Streptomyces sp. NPDC016566]|uniref:transposase n=1 Tax=Streptomyces sp. NPDC016566 TaxID=3364967 RepID=UPI0036F8BFBD
MVETLNPSHPQRRTQQPDCDARCADADLPELQRLATTIETWRPEILAFLHTGITNAGSEGTNRVIKTIARDAYGFRNPGNQRLRTRCATTRRARGLLDAR